jgi:uncharacterized membrane protein YGL010W
MKTLVDHLAQYASYHRDRRNVASHFVGIPLIVLAVAILLSRPGLALNGFWLSPALAVALIAAAFYWRLDVPLGATLAVLLLACLWIGAGLARQPTALWLGSGVGLFVVGWIVQFVGHVYEGRKPAFLDDLTGLAIGPLFVVAEAAFLLGLRRPLRQRVERLAAAARAEARRAQPGTGISP